MYTSHKQLTIEINTEVDGATKFIVTGDVVFFSVARLQHAITKNLERIHGTCWFDLEGVEYIDSAGIGAFFNIFMALQKRGIATKVSNANSLTRTAFRMARADIFFTYG